MTVAALPRGANFLALYMLLVAAPLSTPFSPADEGLQQFGFCVASSADLDGDGRPDILIGAPGDGRGLAYGCAGSGYVTAYSGKTRRQLWDRQSFSTSVLPSEIQKEFPDEWPALWGGFARTVNSIEDVTGDKKPDAISVGARQVLVLSGANGQTCGSPKAPWNARPSTATVELVSVLDGSLWHSAAACADQDGDGRADIVIGNRLGMGLLEVFGSASGELIREVPPREARRRAGVRLLPIGDVDGDGTGDLLEASLPEAGGPQGSVSVLSGRDCSVLSIAENGRSASFSPWSAFAVLPDIDKDGKPDFAVSMTGRSTDGEVRAYSSKTGARLWTLKGPQGEALFGVSLATHPDIDGDGRFDLLIGCPRAKNSAGREVGMIRACTSGDGTPIDEKKLPRSTEEGEWFGFSVAVLGDIDGDGKVEIAAGCPAARRGSVPRRGRVLVFRTGDSSAIWVIKPTF